MITLKNAAAIACNENKNYDYFKEYENVFVFTSEKYPDMKRLVIDKENGSILRQEVQIIGEVISEGNAIDKIIEMRSLSPYHSVRYYFEHELLPKLFFENELGFMSVIANKEKNVLNKIFLKIFEDANLNNPYGDNPIDIEPFAIEDIYIAHITFPAPEDEPLCFETIMLYNIKTNKSGFYCIEKGNDETPRYLCGWSNAEKHLNYGSCSEDMEKVIVDILKIFLDEKDKLEVAGSHTRRNTLKS